MEVTESITIPVSLIHEARSGQYCFRRRKLQACEPVLYRGKGTCAASAQVFSASSTALKFTVNGPCASERPSPSAPCQACFPGVPIRLSVVCDSSWLLLALPKEADPPPSCLLDLGLE